jgi:hypothetical protein
MCARSINLTISVKAWLPSVLLLACLIAGPAKSDSWDAAITKVEKSAAEYFDYAVEVGGTSWVGTMYNGYMSQEHECAILGRMLDQSDAIRHLEEFEYPPMDSRSDPHDLLIFAISLENWVAAARRATSATEDQRKNRWNLDCVGKFAIAPTLFLESGRPEAEFQVEAQQLHVYGDIDAGFAERFEKALDANTGITEVTLGSGGGSVRDAILAGLMIRARNLDTTIYGNCYSACPLVFLGGTKRVVWAAPYRFGFHQVYTREGIPIPFDDELYTLVAKYIAVMGGDPSLVLAWMYSAPPSEMFEPDPSDLCTAKVATFVQRICSANSSP